MNAEKRAAPATLAPTGEAELVALARDGDKRAFEALYRAHVARVYGLCLRLAGDPARAQDHTQDTFVRAWQRLREFRGDCALTTWLHRIAVNEAIGAKRKDARAARHLAAVGGERASVPAETGVLSELERAIASLPERARNVFVLHKIYGYTHREVAAMLNIAVGTCKAQVHRAQKLLAKMPLDADGAAQHPASWGSGGGADE